MCSFRQRINVYRSISWLLILAIVLVSLLPAHYHLHHLLNDDLDSAVTSAASVAHAHVIDLHLSIDNAGQSHHDEDATSIAASPDGIVKKTSQVFSPFILLIIVLALFPVLSIRIKFWLNYNYIALKRSFPHFTPLLRAPPRF